jgi:hypothetical protein
MNDMMGFRVVGLAGSNTFFCNIALSSMLAALVASSPQVLTAAPNETL